MILFSFGVKVVNCVGADYPEDDIRSRLAIRIWLLQ